MATARPLAPDPTPATLARYRDPARVAVFVRTLTAMGIEFHLDPERGRVDTYGPAASPLIQLETDRRAAAIIALYRPRQAQN